MFRRLMVVMAVIGICWLAGQARADTVTTTSAVAVNTAPTVTAVVTTPAVVTTTVTTTAPNTSGFVLASPAIGGDICYDFRAKSIGYGPSYVIGTFAKNQMLEIRSQWVI